MRAINIILVILFIFFIILNIYYSINIRKLQIEKFEITPEPIKFLNSYPNEDISYGSLQTCKGDYCKNTIDKLILNDIKNDTFINEYSNYHNNYTLNNIYNMSKDYRKYNDVMGLHPLLAYRCLNVSPKNLFDFSIGNNYPAIFKSVYIHSESMLIDFIYTQINSVVNYGNCDTFDTNINSENEKYCKTSLQLDKNNNRGSNKIFAPIYIAISQSPYLRSNNKEIEARFDVINNKRSYYVEEIKEGTNVIEKETGNENSSFSSLYANITIIFPLYENSKPNANSINKMKLSNDPDRINKFINGISSFVINNELCHLKCNKMNLSCGCLNKKKQDMEKSFDINNKIDKPFINPLLNMDGIKSYNSVCLSHENKKEDYSIMYYINPYSSFNTIIANILRN